jgi:hypothetical protein
LTCESANQRTVDCRPDGQTPADRRHAEGLANFQQRREIAVE